MDTDWAIGQLTTHATVIEQLCRPLALEDARVKPDEDSWSILQVINHLYDEEREDFRPRIDALFSSPPTHWTPPDFDDWKVEQDYQQRDLHESIDAFVAERNASIAWLRSLEALDWKLKHRHENGFTLSAGDLLASWVAHDVLHTRQLIELHYYLVKQKAKPYSVRYAREW